MNNEQRTTNNEQRTTNYAAEGGSSWPSDIERVWVGSEYWANRLQDWRIANGRLECAETRTAKPMRTVHLLTRRLADRKGELTISVRTGLMAGAAKVFSDTAAGFLIGAGSELDYRAASLVHHSPGPDAGLFAGINSSDYLFIRDFSQSKPQNITPSPQASRLPKNVELRISAKPAGDKYTLTLTSHNPDTGRKLGSITVDGVDPNRLVGNLALVSHPGSGNATGQTTS